MTLARQVSQSGDHRSNEFAVHRDSRHTDDGDWAWKVRGRNLPAMTNSVEDNHRTTRQIPAWHLSMRDTRGLIIGYGCRAQMWSSGWALENRTHSGPIDSQTNQFIYALSNWVLAPFEAVDRGRMPYWWCSGSSGAYTSDWEASARVTRDEGTRRRRSKPSGK